MIDSVERSVVVSGWRISRAAGPQMPKHTRPDVTSVSSDDWMCACCASRPQNALAVRSTPSHETTFAPHSPRPYTTPHGWPATSRFRRLRVLSSAPVGLITHCPSQKPTRTAAIGLSNGMSEMNSAVEAPMIRVEGLAARSGDFELSDITFDVPQGAYGIVIGPTGAGKEVLAEDIHTHSPRIAGRFVAINCGAIPEGLLESELFGHKKGSFTGAVADRRGLFQAAQGGTLFLDEIGDMPAPLQAKLLRALQEKQVRPVGAAQPVAVDVRIISATHRNLEERVKSGEFREDLYYRLNILNITLPPLRERIEDIPVLATEFIRSFASHYKKPVEVIPSETQRLLEGYHWPGNVRELQNCIERAVILTEGDTIHARHLNLSFRDAVPAAPADESPWDRIDLSGTLAEATRRVLSEVERRKIEQALSEAGGNRGRAADLLQVSYKTFLAKLKEHRIE